MYFAFSKCKHNVLKLENQPQVCFLGFFSLLLQTNHTVFVAQSVPTIMFLFQEFTWPVDALHLPPPNSSWLFASCHWHLVTYFCLCRMLKASKQASVKPAQAAAATTGAKKCASAMNHWLRWRPSFPLFTPNGCWCEQMKTARRSHQTHLFTLRQLQRTRAGVLGGGRELGRGTATHPGSWSVITLIDDLLITARQSAQEVFLLLARLVRASLDPSYHPPLHHDWTWFTFLLLIQILMLPSIRLLIHLPSHPSIHPSISPSVHLDIYLIHPFLYPPLDPSFSQALSIYCWCDTRLIKKKSFNPSLDPSVSWWSVSWSTWILICLITSLSITLFVHLSICLLNHLAVLHSRKY